MAKVVIFNSNGVGARIIHTDQPSSFKRTPFTLVDPTFPRGLPPDQWLLKDMQIVPINSTFVPQNNILWNKATIINIAILLATILLEVALRTNFFK
jgi:hypothetical protein